VSLEVEVDPKFLAIPENPEFAPKSPTKGAPKFFKTILEKGAESPLQNE
jgi:hypothetical protein